VAFRIGGEFFRVPSITTRPAGGRGIDWKLEIFPATGAATEIFFEKTVTAFSED
jgi:hypothetical protein